MGNADVKTTNATGVGSKVKVLEERSRKRSQRAQSQRDVEVDQECVVRALATACGHMCARADQPARACTRHVHARTAHAE